MTASQIAYHQFAKGLRTGVEGFPVITYPAALRSQPPTANRFHLTKVGMTGPGIRGRAGRTPLPDDTLLRRAPSLRPPPTNPLAMLTVTVNVSETALNHV
jgi:hypothetical protein